MDEITFTMTWPERGRWAALFNDIDEWPEIVERAIELMGPVGERWEISTVTLFPMAKGQPIHPHGISVKALLIDDDADALALKIAVHDYLIRLVDLTER